MNTFVNEVVSSANHGRVIDGVPQNAVIATALNEEELLSGINAELNNDIIVQEFFHDGARLCATIRTRDTDACRNICLPRCNLYSDLFTVLADEIKSAAQ